jgi:hypothetical protein
MLLADGNVIRSVAVAEPAWFYTPDAIAADQAVAGTSILDLQVRQRGTFGPGDPVIKTLNL